MEARKQEPVIKLRIIEVDDATEKQLYDFFYTFRDKKKGIVLIDEIPPPFFILADTGIPGSEFPVKVDGKKIMHRQGHHLALPTFLQVHGFSKIRILPSEIATDPGDIEAFSQFPENWDESVLYKACAEKPA